MEEKFLKVYRILKWIMLAVFIISVCLIFMPSGYFPFDISSFRRNFGFAAFIIMLVSFASFIYFLIYPALEKFKENMKKSLFEETQQKFDDVDRQIAELKTKMEQEERNNGES